MKGIIFFILFTMLTISTVFGQIKIGDNPQNIDPSSVLELESSSKVLVITRVTTLEMEAITPQRGGMVYNIDTECINYYDGIQWINLCDAVNFTITNDPIINNRVTIEITPTAGGYNLEIAKDGILGDNIVDGGIGPDDIQDNSITQEKLAAESVGSSEIRQNAVGSDEIRDGSIAPTDMANYIPGQVLITDENGIVQWSEADELYDLTFSKLDTTLSITRSTTPGTSTVNLGALIGSDDQILTFTADNKLQIENGNEIDLSILNNPGSDSQTLTLTNDELAITGGNFVSLDPYLDNTDEQNLGTATLTNEQLTINIQRGDPTTADLSAFATDAALTTGLALKENLLNKSDVETLGNSTTLYPTQNAVKVYVDTEIADVVSSGGSDPVNEQNQTFAVVAGELRITDVAGTLAVPLSAIDTNTQLTDAEITALGYIKNETDNQQLTLETGNLLSLTNDATPIDLTPFLDNQIASEVEVTATPLNYTSTDQNIEAHLVGIDIALANSGSTEEADGITITGAGTNADPFKIEPGGNGQFLYTDAGAVTWAVPPGVGIVDGITITGTGINVDPFKIEPGADGEVLTTDINGDVIWELPTTSQDNQTVDEFLFGAGNLLSISLDNDGEIPLNVDLSALEESAAITANTTLINTHITNDGDTDDQNEIELPDDATATSGDVLSTDAAGTYSWITPSLTDTDEQTVDEFLFGAGNLLSISLDNDGEIPLNVDLSALEESAAITANTTLINTHITNDGDTDDQNEIELPDDATATSGDVLSTDATGTYSWITPSITDTDEQTVDEFLFGAGNLLSISLDNDGEIPLNVDLSALEESTAITANTTLINTHITNDGDTDDQNEIELPDDASATSGDVLSTDAAGNYSWITPSITDTDEQTVDEFLFGAGNLLSISLDNDGEIPLNVDLSALEESTAITANTTLINTHITNDGDTDDQNEIELPDDAAATSGDVLSTDAAGTYSWITPSLTDTDEQTVDEFLFGAGNLLSISLDNDGELPVTVDLSDLEESAAITANTTLINNHITNDGDTDDQNEIELPDDATATSGDVLSTDAAGNYSWISNSGLTGATGSIFFADGITGAPSENNNQLRWDEGNDRLAIGNISPQDKLDVDGQVRARNGFGASNGTAGQPTLGFYNDSDTGIYRGTLVNYLRFSTAGTEAITINPTQDVGIGINPTSKLHVNGDIRAEGAITASGLITESTPDYVFQKYFLGNSILNPNYEFTNLSEIEKFVKENNHLPGIKSAAAIKEQGFWDLGEASRINLEKIEELFLHTIEQEKKIKALESANQNMATEVQALKAQMEEIKNMLLEKSNK